MENKVIAKETINKIEIWKDIKDYEGLYQVSNLGNVKSLDKIIYQKNKSGKNQKHIYKGKKLKKQQQRNGYEVVNLYKNAKMTKKLVHRLVATAFIENKSDRHFINHKDNNKTNNNVTNLEWCSQSENVMYAYTNGVKIPPNMRKVKRLDKEGIFIDMFESIQEAERFTNVKATNISKCCRKLRKTAGGYKWEYVS